MKKDSKEDPGNTVPDLGDRSGGDSYGRAACGGRHREDSDGILSETDADSLFGQQRGNLYYR